MKNNLEEKITDDLFDLKSEIGKYLIHWKWFLLSIVSMGILSVFYVKTKVNIYQSESIILVDEETNSASELMAFADLPGLNSGPEKDVLEEVEVLKSRTLIGEVIQKLNFNISYYKKEGFKNLELYKHSPITVKPFTTSQGYFLDTLMKIKFLNEKEFQYTLDDETYIKKVFGEQIKIKNAQFIVLPNEENIYTSEEEQEISIEFSSLENKINKTKKLFKISFIDENADVLKLSYTSTNKLKSRDFLNTLISTYNQNTINDKNLVGYKTDEFIEKRLSSIKTELDQIDFDEQKYKSKEELTNIELQSEAFVNRKSKNENELFDTKIQLDLVSNMIDEIQSQDQDTFELLPSNIGTDNNPGLVTSIKDYNTFLLERDKRLQFSTNESPVVKNIDRQLDIMLSNIKSSLLITKKQLKVKYQALQSNFNSVKKDISSIPLVEREYRSIVRKQKIIAELYSYLLEKKEENKISMAVTAPNAKVIDVAYTLKNPVKPKKKIIVLAGLIIGLLIPFVIIYIRGIFDTSIHSRQDLEGVITAPVIGDIPVEISKEKIVVREGSRSSTSEAFRLLRTNLDFMMAEVSNISKTIFVTSTVSGEGKSFVSVNTACTLALSGKRVLLVGMDLRAPKITQYLGLPTRSGVTNYLINKDADLNDLIFSLDGFENLDVLSSGIVPPNPAELLLSPRIGEMFEDLRLTYDYIIVDTAPVNLVTDTLMLSDHADMFLYVTRAEYIDKRLLSVPETLYKEKRLPNMAILLNGLDHKKAYGYGGYGGYGYGYGYGDDIKKKNIFQKIFNRS